MVDAIVGLALSLAIVMPVGISVTTGVAQGVSEQHKQNADASNQTRMLKFHLDVLLDPELRSPKYSALHNSIITLHHDKVWVDVKNPATNLPLEGKDGTPGAHPFTGFYVAYPDDQRSYTRGLVSTISVDPPMLNWIYINKDTYEVKYASRSGSIMHHVGDFDWTTEDNEDSMVIFNKFEGFVAVEEEEGKWALYFDYDDDGFQDKSKGRRTVEVHLQRRVLTGQEVNKWGLKEEGNIGFRSTREV
ncbi:uncharacterized protein RCC_03170 [Ramularia collo-cygni]|uniref:Uncharacterized protein n=1 Tax=Ramularia collo-cygni TaxID=112498 RepID=A0A2D3V1D4_9PEZI|nr:uncharacterized protein RCC_03170 [Ramularia collo-cygni]CZT17336.1 uncharacterized protein RCC_03170 [Ramularia collo-cygni]